MLGRVKHRFLQRRGYTADKQGKSKESSDNDKEVVAVAVFIFRPRWFASLLSIIACLTFVGTAAGQALVPGTGERNAKVGDDFEDPNWGYTFNNPKNSSELDGQSRLPDGFSNNRRWFEGPMRGNPDVLRRVPTPEGGLPGSTGALLIRTLQAGTPGRPSGHSQQDDLIVNVRAHMGGTIPVSWLPSCVVRVYMPPFDEWEKRTGNTFAVRAGTYGVRPKGEGESEEYWPGMFIQFQSKADRRHKQDAAHFLLRAGPSGQDFKGPEITETGWWTLGMSFTADGQVHYYASPGVDDLTAKDHIASQNPYGFRCQRFETFFFDIIAADDGRTWSTPWIIDDASLYLARQPKVAAKPNVGTQPRKRGRKR